MKKEISGAIGLGLLLLAYAIDYLAGPVKILIRSQLVFLRPEILSLYPFTAAAIFIRTLGIVIVVLVLFSLVNRQYFAKAGILLFLCVMAELYGFQQIPASFKLISIQWTLSIAYAGFIAVIPVVFFILMGIGGMFNKEAQTGTEAKSENQKSVLEPPESTPLS